MCSKTRTEEAEDRSDESSGEEGLDELLPRGIREQQQHHPGGPQTSTPHPTVKDSYSVANSSQPGFSGGVEN